MKNLFKAAFHVAAAAGLASMIRDVLQSNLAGFALWCVVGLLGIGAIQQVLAVVISACEAIEE